MLVLALSTSNIILGLTLYFQSSILVYEGKMAALSLHKTQHFRRQNQRQHRVLLIFLKYREHHIFCKTKLKRFHIFYNFR